MTKKETTQTPKAETMFAAICQAMKEGNPRYLAYGLIEENMDALYKSACNLYAEKDYEEALGLFKRLATYNQLDPRGSMGMGICLQELGEYDAAGVSYLLSAQIKPEAKTLFSAVDCFVALKNYSEAIKTLDRIISLFQELPHGSDLKKEAEEAKISLLQLA